MTKLGRLKSEVIELEQENMLLLIVAIHCETNQNLKIGNGCVGLDIRFLMNNLARIR
jgi:hypothetical protein